jgi:hypothetical protein
MAAALPQPELLERARAPLVGHEAQRVFVHRAGKTASPPVMCIRLSGSTHS